MFESTFLLKQSKSKGRSNINPPNDLTRDIAHMRAPNNAPFDLDLKQPSKELAIGFYGP